MQLTRRDVMRMVYHAVEGDVPVENMLAFIEEVQKQPG